MQNRFRYKLLSLLGLFRFFCLELPNAGAKSWHVLKDLKKDSETKTGCCPVAWALYAAFLSRVFVFWQVQTDPKETRNALICGVLGIWVALAPSSWYGTPSGATMIRLCLTGGLLTDGFRNWMTRDVGTSVRGSPSKCCNLPASEALYFVGKSAKTGHIWMASAHGRANISRHSILEKNLASRWEGVRLPRASGKSPDFPGSSPNFPGSFSATSPEVLSLWNLAAIQGFPGSFPDLPGSSPDFPGSFPDFPGGQPFLWEAWHPLLTRKNFLWLELRKLPVNKPPARHSLIWLEWDSLVEKNIGTAPFSSFKGQKGAPKPKDRTNSTKEFSEQFEGTTQRSEHSYF